MKIKSLGVIMSIPSKDEFKKPITADLHQEEARQSGGKLLILLPIVYRLFPQIEL